jgi:hypothetical protein
MHRVVVVGIVTGCATVTTPRTPRDTLPSEPDIAYYREIWLRLAAEANDIPPEKLAGLVHVTASNIACPWDCRLEVKYTLALGWLAVTTRDYIYVRSRGSDRWASEATIRRDADEGDERIESNTADRGTLALAFASRDAAVEAFVARFGHAPEEGFDWVEHGGKGIPFWEHPVLVSHHIVAGCDHDEQLDLVTGSAELVPSAICSSVVDRSPKGRDR